MDLPTVKATVKAWEKAFKAHHQRDPTKEDIKKDASGIAEQYSLYRKLSKSSTSSSQSQSQGARPQSSSQVASSSTSQTSRTTPRVLASNGFPTTPTPPTRRHSGKIPDHHHDDDREEVSLQAGPSTTTSKSLKRTASKASLQQPTSPAHKLLTTPKKRPYTGPIHDPNPINPFAASPLRRSAMKNGDDNAAQPQEQIASPFFHASSPSKLKELLQQNSLRKVQERNSPMKEITPRTKARKRLTGEIEETPAKSRVRRKRGAGAVPDVEKGLNASSNVMKLDESIEDEDEDEFGPTPIKRQPEAFHTFFDLDDPSGTAAAGPSRTSNGLSRSGSSNMVGRLLAAGGKGKETAASPSVTRRSGKGAGAIIPSSPPHANTETPAVEASDDLEEGADMEDQMAPSLGDEQDEVEAPSKTKEPPRPEKTVSISDDELDEWDPEASHVKHRVRIVPTRSRPTKRWSDSDDNDSNGGADADERSDPAESDDEVTPPLDETTTSQTNQSIQSPPPLLSLLSLTSPNQRQGRYARLKELRYKALFNPSGSDARKLKAFTKGQEAFVAGEAEDQDEEDELEEVEENERERADDDWESESDGWNRTGVEMDDDAW